MTVNASARIARILIGNKDFSSCLISFQGSDSHLDQSGLISFTGSITLGRSLGFDESLDDRKNPTRFCRGTKVIISIADSTGTLQRHPRGTLRILTPKYELESQRLTLEVGDLIALLNFKEPTDPDKADNKSLEGKTAGAIITTLLGLAGIGAVAGTLPSTIYNYPLNLSGSYLQSVGKLLYANNMFGWIDENEVFQVRNANIIGGGSGVSLVIGENEIWYKRLDGVESPCEIIKATGTEMIVRPTPDYLEDTSEEYASASTVSKDYGNFTIVIQKTKTVREWKKGQHKLIVTTSTDKPFGLVIPETFWNKDGEFVLSPLLSLIDSETIVETSYFEEKQECKLKSKETKIYQPRATYLAEFKDAKPKTYYFGSTNTLNLIKSIRETYEYDIKDRLKKITTKVSELEISILNGTDENWSEWIFPPEDLVQSEYTVQEWKELNKDNWNYRSSSYQCLVRVKSELVKYQTDSKVISNKLNLIYATGESRTSNSGQEVPPAPERCPTELNYEENNIEEKALFADTCASDLKQRERTFNVEFLSGRQEPSLRPGEVVIYAQGGSGTVASNQLQAIAQKEGRLLQGRYKGQELAMAIVDEIFNYYPLYPIQATEPDGTIQNYLADGCSWVVSQTRALWSCDGIWVGTTISGAIVRHYTEPQLAYLGLGLGIEFKSYPYLLETITNFIQLGMAQGTQWSSGFSLVLGMGLGSVWSGDFISLYWESLEWDSTDESTWNNILAT